MSDTFTLGIIDYHLIKLDDGKAMIKEALAQCLSGLMCLQVLLPAHTANNSFGLAARIAILECAAEHPDISFNIIEITTRNEVTALCNQKELRSAANKLSIQDATLTQEYLNVAVKELVLFSYGGNGFTYLTYQSQIQYDWIIDHADTVWCYAYKELLGLRDKRWVENLCEKNNICYLTDKNTEAKIAETIGCLDPRRREIYQRVMAGEMVSKIAQELGIKRTEAHYLFKKATKAISGQLRIRQTASPTTSPQIIYTTRFLKQCLVQS